MEDIERQREKELVLETGQENSIRSLSLGMNEMLRMMHPIHDRIEDFNKRLEAVERKSKREVDIESREDMKFDINESTSFKARLPRRSADLKSQDHTFESPTGSDNESDTFGPSRRTGDRRKSLMEEDLTSSRRDRSPVQFLQTAPDYSHINLRKTTLWEFDTFVEQIKLHESKYGTVVRAATLIDKRVIQSLLASASNEGYDVTEISFYSLKLSHIAKLFRLHLKPTNKSDFEYKLSHNVFFPELSAKYEMSVTNFAPFFEALMIYMKSFKRIYDFLATANHKSVPNCDMKRGGTLACFIDKIPNGYGAAVLQTLGVHRFDDVDTMLQDFQDQIASDMRESKASRDLHLRLFAAKKHLSVATFGPSKRTEPSSAVGKQLNLIRQEDEVSDSGEEREVFHAPTQEDRFSDSEQDLAVVTTQVRATDYKKSDTVRGCQRMLFTGDCANKASCKFSHEKAVLQEMWKQYSKFLKESKYATTSLSNGSESMHNMTHVMCEVLHSMVPNTSILRAVYKSAKILVGDQFLKVDKTLFDTGALQGCYIDKTLVENNMDFLGPCLRKSKIAVIMADNKTTAYIENVARLKVQFEHAGKTYTVQEDFAVLDMHGGNQMIVGLPTIVFKLLTLFQNMLEDAVTNLCVIEDDSERFRVFTGEAEEIQEEADTPMPCAFNEFLHFTNISKEQALENYISLFTAHIAPEFAQQTKVIELLKVKGAQVFIPQNWDGINGIEPLELTFREEIPKSKPHARPVNPRLFENAKAEFLRLNEYMYRASNSDVASPLVIAPKATKPFIRFCGDYTKINKYIVNGHYPIPKVIHEIERLIQFKYFLDIDMKNAFHQIRLGPKTSSLLSLQTIWGQVEPLFLQEGVGPATGILQRVVVSIFEDFADWMIVVFDNFLLCAHDYDDAYKKLEKFLDRCIERNVWCNFEKSWFGFTEVLFFGYRCSNNRYEITDERMQGLIAVPFPESTKEMQRFLGMILFCSRHIEGYVDLVAPLYDMTKIDFSWDAKTWKRDFRADFEKVKRALLKAVSLFYPDYDLPWIVRPDCSDIGAGALLIQERTDENGVVSEEIINSAHKKFSGSARKWPPSKKEAFGVYFGPKSFEYYLRGKEFTIKTDHANLRYMETNTEPIIMRWWSLLQSFSMTIVYEKGKNQFAPDFLSRLHALQEQVMDYGEPHGDGVLQNCSSDSEEMELCLATEQPTSHNDPGFYLRQVHGGRMGHNGARRTYQLLNQHFEGHKITYAVVADFVATCAICQKDRLGMTDTITPTVRHLKPAHANSRIGMDLLTVTPTDKQGNTYIHVISNHFTHHIGLYPAKDKTALTAATALFQHVCAFGMTDELITDPGSDYTSEMMAHLTEWFGLRQTFSLVDRHESNGVECPSKLVLNLLRALVYDERIVNRWSEATVLPLIAFTINDFVSSEAGFSPFQLTFGRQSSVYNKLPAGANPEQHVHEFVKLLNDDLTLLRQISKEFQSKLILKRTEKNPEQPNEYQPGDFVLFQISKDKPRPSKLTPSFKGPFSVISQRNNDVECRHVVGGHIEFFHVSRLKIFHGSAEEAYKAALLDNDQFVVKEFLAYRGEPLKRTTMQFEVQFEEGSILWLPWSLELFDNVHYEVFCRGNPELYVLVFGAKEADDFVKRKNKEIITSAKPGDTCFVDIRYYGAAWSESIGLPDFDHRKYVVEHKYVKWANSKQTEIIAECKLFNELFTHKGYFVFSYGSVQVYNPKTMTRLDKSWITRFPKLLPDDRGVVAEPKQKQVAPVVSKAMVNKDNPTVVARPAQEKDTPTVVKALVNKDNPSAKVVDPRAGLRRKKQIPSKFRVNNLSQQEEDL